MRAAGFVRTPMSLYRTLALHVGSVDFLSRLTGPVSNVNLVVPSVQILRSNYSHLLASKRVQVYVCDVWPVLRGCNLQVLDQPEQQDEIALDIDLLDKLGRLPKWEYRARKVNVQKRLLQSLPPSVIHELHHMIMQLKEKALRERVRQACMETLLDRPAKWPVLSKAARNLFRDALCSDRAVLLRQAIKETRACNNAVQVATKLGLSAYDIRYTLSYEVEKSVRPELPARRSVEAKLGT